MAKEPHPNKRLHFIVRDENYSQTIGYGHFLDRILHTLNREPPADARALLEQTAKLMLNPRSNNIPLRPQDIEKDPRQFYYCLPDETASHFNLNTDSFDPYRSGKGRVDAYNKQQKLFGPAAAQEFGLLYPQLLEYRRQLANGGYRSMGRMITAPIEGFAQVTDILSNSGASYRGYFNALSKHYGLKAGAVPADFHVRFSYPIPGSGEELPLMQIGTPQTLEADFRGRYKGDASVINTEFQNFKNISAVSFLHPNVDEAYMEKLVLCLTPLQAAIDAPPAEPVDAGTPPPQEKLEAVAAMYWLLAQTTPVIRGGSAYANVILEHEANRLRKQGYDYEIPYTAKGVDLWSEAAMLPLEDDGKLKGFTSRFTGGQFFDHQVQDQDVEQFLLDNFSSEIQPLNAESLRAALHARKDAPVRW